MSEILIPKYKICILQFEDIFQELEISLINDLERFGLIKNNSIDLRNTDTKKLMYHHIILNLCQKTISAKKLYKSDVIIVYNEILRNSEICKYVDCEKLYIQIKRIFTIIEKNLFIQIFHISKKVLSSDFFENGFGLDSLKLIITTVEKFATEKRLDFSKIEDFTKKNGLTFLNREYFSEVNNRFTLSI